MKAINSAVLALSMCAFASSVTGHAQEGEVLGSAAVQIAMTSPTTCEVTISLTTDASGDVDHRVEAPGGTYIELEAVRDAAEFGSQRQVGTTRSLVVRPGAGKPYQLRYRVSQPDRRAFRCPVWTPAVATDGRSRQVTITVTLPERSSPTGRSFPTFSWNGTEGAATLGHLPAFVRVPYDTDDGTGRDPASRDIAQTMDRVALGVLAAATAAWVWRRNRA